MKDIIDVILNDDYSKTIAWFIGVFSGIIAIYQYFSVQTQKTSAYNDSLEIDINSRGVCADCQSYISNNTKSCPKCGSTLPFDEDKLIKRIEEKLICFFDIALNYNKGNEVMRWYVIAFFPSLIFALILIAIGEFIFSKNLYPFVAIIALLYISISPHYLINEYSGRRFSLSNLNSDKLLSFDHLFDDIIRSLGNNKDALEKLEKIFIKYISIGKSSTSNRNKYLLYTIAYFAINITMIFFVSFILSISLKTNDYSITSLVGVSIFSLIPISLVISIYKLSYIHLHYVNHINKYVIEYNLIFNLRKIEEKLGKHQLPIWS